MKKISELFSRFTNFIPPERILKEKIIEVVEINSGIKIDPKDIKIEKGRIRLNIGSNAKIRVLIKKDRIMENLRDSLGEKSPQDIV